MLMGRRRWIRLQVHRLDVVSMVNCDKSRHCWNRRRHAHRCACRPATRHAKEVLVGILVGHRGIGVGKVGVSELAYHPTDGVESTDRASIVQPSFFLTPYWVIPPGSSPHIRSCHGSTGKAGVGHDDAGRCQAGSEPRADRIHSATQRAMQHIFWKSPSND